MPSDEQNVLVLRMPAEEGNYAYRLAELSVRDAPRWEQLLASGDIAAIEPRVQRVVSSPLLRTAFVLRDVQGYSTGEAAKKLGVTENTLKARLWRARHQLDAPARAVEAPPDGDRIVLPVHRHLREARVLSGGGEVLRRAEAATRFGGEVAPAPA